MLFATPTASVTVAAQAAPAQAAAAPTTVGAPLIVTGRKTIERRILQRGWLIEPEATDLSKVADSQVVCERLSRLNSRIIHSSYTCGTAAEWRVLSRLSKCSLMRSVCS